MTDIVHDTIAMGEEIFASEFCHLYWMKDMNAVREDWHIANCPFEEFRDMLYFMMEFCVKNGVKNLIIDTFNAISMLPETHHEWLDKKFNRQFVKTTEIEQIFLIVPESLVTSISVNKYYESIKRNDLNISVYKMRSLRDAINMLNVKSGS